MMHRKELIPPSTKPSSISSDVIETHILPRLPVKSLCRFKSVSKNWNSQISSKDFVEKHLKYQTTNKFPCLFYQAKTDDDDALSNLFSIKLHKIDDHILGFKLEVSKLNHGYDYKPSYKFPLNEELIGTCNGLVCLQFVNRDYIDARHGHPICFVLWNPFIHLQRTIKGKFVPFQSHIKSSGFGFVSSTDDYKIVFLEEYDSMSRVVGHLYSLKRIRWTKISTPSDLIYRYGYHVTRSILVKETLYWLFKGNGLVSRLLALELNTEVFSSVSLPDEVLKPLDVKRQRELFLCKFEECMCVCWMELKAGKEKTVVDLKMWRLIREGDFFSWELAFDFRNLCWFLWDIRSCLASQTWFMLEDRDMGRKMICLGVYFGHLVSVHVYVRENMYKEEYTKIEVGFAVGLSCAVSYVESLVSPFYNAVRVPNKRKAKMA